MNSSTLPAGWLQYSTPAGKEYFHNAALNITTWDRPKQQPEGFASTATGTLNASKMESGPMSNSTQPELDGSLWFASMAENFDMAKNGQEHFNVTTQDVVDRLITASLPYKLISAEGKSVFRDKPDIYGPFWICCTLIFAVFACSNGYLWACGALQESDFKVIIVAVLQVFGFWIGVPLALNFALVWSGADPTLLPLREVLCVYGYSLAATIPMCLLCMVPFKLSQVVFCIVALCWSVGLVAVNFLKELKESLPHIRYLIVSFFALSLAAFYLIFPAYYFKLPSGFLPTPETVAVAAPVAVAAAAIPSVAPAMAAAMPSAAVAAAIPAAIPAALPAQKFIAATLPAVKAAAAAATAAFHGSLPT